MKPSMKPTVRRTNVSAVVTIVIVITGLASCLAARAGEPPVCRQKSQCSQPTWCEGCCQPICCCPDDYCRKSIPCVPCLRGPWCCDDYCHKSLPCLPCTPLGRCCDDYCEKPCPACPPRLCTDLNRFRVAGASRHAELESAIDMPTPSVRRELYAGPQPPSPASAPLFERPNPLPRSSLLPLPPLQAEMPSPTGTPDTMARRPAVNRAVR